MVPGGTLALGQEGQGEHLGPRLLVRLHGHHGAQLGQRKQPFGHQLVSDIGVVIPAQVSQTITYVLFFYLMPD